jgi:hypothetical protein
MTMSITQRICSTTPLPEVLTEVLDQILREAHMQDEAIDARP